MATFNANTVRRESRASELAQCFISQHIDILGIQEHRRVHEESVAFSRLEGQYLITSSAWRNQTQASVGGVGLMLSSRARKALRRVTSHTERILVAEFNSNPVTTVIVAYSPTNISPTDVVENFYDELSSLISGVPAHNFLSVLGDFNARLGPEDVPFPFHSESNRNGKYLAEMITEHCLLAANTQFRKKLGKRWTYQDRGTGVRRQLDYILVRRKWRNSVLNAESYNTFCTVGSDHRVVSMKVRLSLRVSKHCQQTRYDWKKFSERSDLHQQYTVEVRNRFQLLEEEEDPTDMYQRFVDANREAMEACVPKRERRKKLSHSKHPDVIKAREKLRTASQKYDSTGAEEDYEQMKQTKDLLFSTYDKLREREIMDKVDQVQHAHGAGQYGEAWKVINEVTGRKKSKEGQVAGASPEERVTTWFNHFKKLLGDSPSVQDPDEEIPIVFSDLDIDDGPFTEEEYAKAKSNLKLGKSPGPDNIPPEVLKNCELDDIILKMCNMAMMNSMKPEQWSLSNIIPIPKKGNLSNVDNYRGISLTCITAKLFNRMILNRIRSVIDPKLRVNQNGFRPKRTTVSQILALRRIIEEVKKNNLPAVLTFIDFKKAFDSIHRRKMMKILKAYGIPPNLLSAIESMYTNTRAKVVTADGETEEFDILAGVLQGDTLAPFLFIIVLDYALRCATTGMDTELGFTITPRKSRRFPAVSIIDLDFADDISLLSDQIQQAQQLLLRVETECNKVGLGLNAIKTEVMTYNIPEHEPLRTASGDILKEVDDFKYLGSWVESTEADIKIRKALAWKALNKMGHIWKSHMSRDVKLSFFIATVESVLLYGCESWTLTSALERSLNGCYTRMLRAVLNINWSQHIPNTELYGDLPRVADKVASRRMQLAGHCYRHPELAASGLILWEPTHGHRSRGGQRKTFIDVLKRDAGTENTSELAACMRDRVDWKIRTKSRLRTT